MDTLKQWVKKLDYFELGNSFFLYYLLLFGGLPLAVWLRLPSKYVEYFIGQSIPIFNAKIFVYLLIGILCFLFGYKFLNFREFAERISRVFKKGWAYERTLRVFWVVFFVNLSVKAVRIFGDGYFHLAKSQSFTGSSFYSLIGLLDWFGPISLAIVFGCYFDMLKIGDSRYKIWRIIAWPVFVFEFIYGFFSGSKFYAIIPIIVYLITRIYIYRREFWRFIIIGILILFVLMPVQNFYRNHQNFLIGYSVPVDHQSQITSLSVLQYIFDSSIGRLNQSFIISAVFEKTDEFLYGKSLLNFFVSLGPPRFIWKNKPVINASGNEFGRKYGILSPDDFGTSVAPTIVGDFYLNFGVWGIVLGMLLFGVLLRFIFDVLIRYSGASLSGIMIYSVFWIQIIKGMEDWLVPVWAGLVKLSVILLVIHFALVYKSKK